MTKAKWSLAAATTLTALGIAGGPLWFRMSASNTAHDFEQCAEQAEAEAAATAQRAALLTDCGARFAGRRKTGGGYSYYDFMQGRSFDIAGPNPTTDERKQIDQEYIRYLDSVRRDTLSAKSAQQRENVMVADVGTVPPAIGQTIGPPIVLTPKRLPPAKSPLADRKMHPQSAHRAHWAVAGRG